MSKVATEVIKMKYAKKRLGNELGGEVYIIKSFGISDEGLQFKVNERFKVLEADGDVVLIEKMGDTNNPKRNRDPNYRWTDANRWDKD